MTTPLVRIVDDDADARSSSSFFLSMMGLEIKELSLIHISEPTRP